MYPIFAKFYVVLSVANLPLIMSNEQVQVVDCFVLFVTVSSLVDGLSICITFGHVIVVNGFSSCRLN